MVAVGDPHADFNVGLIEAAAALAEPATLSIPEAFFAKYAVELAAANLDRDTFRATYTQAIRIEPTRFVAWHGRGERPAASPAEGAAPAPRLAMTLAAWLDRASARLRGVGTPTRIPAPLGA